MDRSEALGRLQGLIGQDLRPLADRLGVTVWTPEGRKNKGWAGHTIERYLELPLNSSRAPNFGSWELKVVPLKQTAKGLCVKETMAITMLDPVEVAAKEFAESHLHTKLCKQIIVSRVHESVEAVSSVVCAATAFGLDDPHIYALVKADYDLIREIIVTKGFAALSGRYGRVVQPRTKGPGHGSVSRAFYARTQFVAYILGLAPKPCADFAGPPGGLHL